LSALHEFYFKPNVSMIAAIPSATILTQAKLTALRRLMVDHQVDGYLVPSNDEHLNEYVPEAKQRRSWVSGFTGSAGDFWVGLEQAWVFVDSRYYEQADLEIDESLIQVSKLELSGHKTLVETLETQGQNSSTVFRLGFDPFTVSVEQFRTLEKQLKPSVELVAISVNLIDQVRAELEEGKALPPYASSPVFRVPDALTGSSVEQKLQQVREALQKSKANILPITKLDQIAWVFNLRGWDVPYNPVFIAYAVISTKSAYLFTNLERLDPQIQQALQCDQVQLLPYAAYAGTLQALTTSLQPAHVVLDTRQTTMGTYHLLVEGTSLTQSNVQLVEIANPIEKLKACKNLVEIDQMQRANLKASRAKTRTLKWVSEQLAACDTALTELDVADAIARFYAVEEGFQGLSFNTIAATGANSSIVHYGTPSPQVVLQPGDLLLIDSGAQYLGGTTDDTRTLAIGQPTAEQIERYTEVLKAHINCAMQRFPRGTTGVQLDGITRSDLWMAGLDYGHGTGHGVGAFLNVHEGPNGISKRAQEPLEPGMINSIEPGYYEPGWGGIRLENLYVVRDLSKTDGTSPEKLKSTWYGFESLTYIPFDKTLIDLNRLDVRQRQWLKNYYATVVEKLSPSLDAEELAWLEDACSLEQV
jgi:Xaa-Pro aminopeptidase